MSKLNTKLVILLIILLVIFIMLFLTDHSKLDTVEQKAVLKVETLTDHKTRLEERRSRLQSVCRQFGHNMRLEHSSVFKRKKLVNSCTGKYFKIQGKDHFICNVLKGGSSSWEMFFGENNITSFVLASCEDNEMFIGNCPSHTELKLVQVRHPLARLLATYRHVFKNSGWKDLDVSLQGRPDLEKEYAEFFSKDWAHFVDEVVLKDEFNKTEQDLEHLDESGVLIKHHWAPYWYTCGLCSPEVAPDIIIKTETLEWDIPPVLDMFDLPGGTSFPHIRVTGRKEIEHENEEEKKGSEEVVEKYFSQLTKQQVVRLYEMYKLDHLMFDYSPQKHIDVAR